MIYPKSQRQDLRELAATRRAGKAARIARVLELHAQGLPCSVIAERLQAGFDWVKNVIKANGKAPVPSCKVDLSGVPV